MQCYTELTPPTACTQSLTVSLLHAKATNLVVAKTSLLQIFDLKHVVAEADTSSTNEVETSPQDIAADTADRSYLTSDVAFQRVENITKLVLVAEYPLSGTVLSIQKIKPSKTKSGGDALLIAFLDAKFSLLEWDPEVHALSTISIHFYEAQGDLYPWAGDFKQYRTFLSVDPNNKCAALKFGPRQLAILPFRQAEEEVAEDDLDLDMHDGETDIAIKSEASPANKSNDGQLYNRSFVLPTTALDPRLTHPIHVAFLHEYRQPTIGVLSAAKIPAVSNLHERKDAVIYSVFTLDLDQKASTTILTVPNLPFDLRDIVPLTQPVGGVLLVGANELVHVDQAGKTVALAVNEFAKRCSSFSMLDQSDCKLQLEDCVVEPLSENGDMLIVMRNGQLAILSFKLDGRTVAALEIHVVSAAKGGHLLTAPASCISSLGRGRIFVGSEDGDGVVLHCQRKVPQLTRKRSLADMLGEEQDLDLDEDDLDDDIEDDIYGDGGDSAVQKRRASAIEAADASSAVFRVHDRLPNYAPVGDTVLAQPTRPKQRSEGQAGPELYPSAAITYPTGKGTSGGLTRLGREIDPTILQTFDLPDVNTIWSVSAQKAMQKPAEMNEEDELQKQLDFGVEYDQYVIASRITEQGGEESTLYTITPTGLEIYDRGDFEPDAGATVAVGTLGGGTMVLQVLSTEVRRFDSSFGLEQIVPIIEEETESDAKIIGASFCDTYALIIKDDATISLIEATKSGDLEEIEISDALSSTKWVTGSLYSDKVHTNGVTVLFLLSTEGALTIFELPDLSKPSFASPGLAYVPSNFSQDFTVRRAAAKETLTEILVTNIGDTVHSSPYLIARTSTDDLVIYQPYHVPSTISPTTFSENLRFLKIPQPRLAHFSEEPELESQTSGREAILHSISNVGGYSTVLQSGTSPCLILKEASAAPRVINLRSKAVKGVAGFNTVSCDRGFAYLDAQSTLRICQLPTSTRYGDTGWVSSRVALGEEVRNICWHDPQRVFVLASSTLVDFKLPEDDYHHEWAKEDTTFLPKVEQSSIKLLDPITLTIIDAFECDYAEVVMSMKVINLEVNEATGQRKDVVVAGTALYRGEDLASKGNLYVFDVASVIPQPGYPETSRRLRLIAKEEVKGAVTAISEVGQQGFFLMAQGQKVMVRGMKEDGLIPPLAFMDVQNYVTVISTLPGTGMSLIGDAIKGLWFAGYTEEPYRMILLSKGPQNMQVMAGDFMPAGQSLYLTSADADSNLHIFQYDPEHPSTLNGYRLLHKSTFHTGHFPISIKRVPSTAQWTTAPTEATTNGFTNGDDSMDLDDNTTTQDPHALLYTSTTGVLGLLTPIPEPIYRRLIALQTHMITHLEHPCALNPKGYRAVEHERFGSRGVLDGGLLRRWNELSSLRRQEGLGKIGLEAWTLRADLEMLGADGALGYL